MLAILGHSVMFLRLYSMVQVVQVVELSVRFLGLSKGFQLQFNVGQFPGSYLEARL